MNKKDLSLLSVKELQKICSKTLNDDGTYRINNYTRSKKSELIAKYPSIEFHSLLINSFTSFKIIEDLELVKTKEESCSSIYSFVFEKENIFVEQIIVIGKTHSTQNNFVGFGA